VVAGGAARARLPDQLFEVVDLDADDGESDRERHAGGIPRTANVRRETTDRPRRKAPTALPRITPGALTVFGPP
jgi:hypothetical protein